MAIDISEELNEFLRFDPRISRIAGKLEVIVKYNGDINRVANELGVDIEILDDNYAIITAEVSKIPTLYTYSEVEYIELPKTLTFVLSNSLNSACITSVQSDTTYGLRGRGTIIGIIDSGIDYTHKDFINEDETSRILFLWDQTRDGNPPTGFKNGFEYTNDIINEALKREDPLSIVPVSDFNGHGTAVSGIAAGNGRTSGGRERGAAPEASLIVVKLGQTGVESYARSTEIMRALKYISDKAAALRMPVAINISFGTNNGAHDGLSLFETYVDSVSNKWKTVVVAATGNEGSAGHHYSNRVEQGQRLEVNFVTSGSFPKMYMTLWKNFVDTFTAEIIAPDGSSSGEMRPAFDIMTFNLSGVDITIFNQQPTNYSESQGIYFLIDGRNELIPEGVWTLVLNGVNVIDGRIDIWLPTIEDVSAETSFTEPSSDKTLTLPSTALKVISVGGYDANIGSIAEFSGRGYTRSNVYIKPDLVAPAVNILTTRAGGGYDSFTGTSMAAPFVTGAASLMMEWGIVNGNDPFLYGQRVKAFLQKGAGRNFRISYPNNQWGYGTLCLSGTMRYLSEYIRG